MSETNETAAINQARDAIVSTPAGHLVRLSGTVRPGDLEWTINSGWQPVHASLVGKPVIDLPGQMVARKREG